MLLILYNGKISKRLFVCNVPRLSYFILATEYRHIHRLVVEGRRPHDCLGNFSLFLLKTHLSAD